LTAVKSGLLLFTGTLIGVALARYVKRLWEVLPLCLVMMLADFSSWAIGPTAEFAREIEAYYLDPVGPAPLIDMVLVKFAYPGAPDLIPVFGVSDWIIVVFFAALAQRYQINDNLLGVASAAQPSRWLYGRYLPVAVVALFLAIMLAHASGSFIPALPLIVLVVVVFYLLRTLPQKLFRTKY
jgi:ABC-type xylose transport system permease subunit